MTMQELMQFIKNRRPAGTTIVWYAGRLGITRAAYYNYLSEERTFSQQALERMAKYFDEVGDTEALSKIASYSLGIQGEFIPLNEKETPLAE